MTLSPQFLDELRGRTLLSALVGRSVKLQKAGREYKACCPFHQEKSPSFYVNDEKGFYHCFGCGAHGDAIRFLTEAQGLPFIDAVKELAQAAGMEMPAPDPRAAEKAERQSGLHDVMTAAARWFEDQLGGIEGGEARAYLERRGVSEATRRAFGFGFAPDSRGKLKAALAKAGEDKLIEAGLLISVEEKEPYDRFRGRLMIPIRDPRGRVIAFGGRIIGEGEPKYLNSPDTPLFDKGRTLFNLDRAAPAARKAGRIIVVEGYMDVIALAQAGIEEAVAPLGTALTEAQLERLWRIGDLPILCFDGDSAGQKAAIRAAHRALPMIAPGRSLRFVTLPKGQDPDDLVRAGGREAMEAILEAPEALAQRLWAHELAAAPLDTPEGRAGLRKRLADLAGTIEDRDVRDQYLAEFRGRFDEAFARRRPSPEPGRPGRFQRGGRFATLPRPASERARAIGVTGVDRMIARAVIAGLIQYPDQIGRHTESLAGLALGDPTLDRVRDALLDAALARQVLDSQQALSILRDAGLGVIAEELRQTNGLAFSFLRGNADTERAKRDLGEAIDVLVARPAIDRALAKATERFGASTDEEAFAEQQRLFEAKRSTERRLMELMQPDSGAGL
jgi:DNA primase